MSTSIEECAVTCAAKGHTVFVYGKYHADDSRCFKPGDSTEHLGSSIEQKGNVETDTCVCICEYSTKDGNCRYGTVEHTKFDLYKQIFKGTFKIEV